MKITSRFTIAIQTMLCIAAFSKDRKVTSNFIAGSTNVNPVIIRRLIGQLKEAGLVEVKAGVGGTKIKKDLSDITLLDIFNAIQAVEENFFNFHMNPNCDCPLGKNIHTILDSHLNEIQEAMTDKMKSKTLQMLFDETKQYI
ncbi:MAG: Rrf2 family transcriptional regulator [Fusobacterium sp. JB019]|nr:Rrf2 family transcriptional regulator [Fusobacterium sp. JB019]